MHGSLVARRSTPGQAGPVATNPRVLRGPCIRSFFGRMARWCRARRSHLGQAGTASAERVNVTRRAVRPHSFLARRSSHRARSRSARRVAMARAERAASGPWPPLCSIASRRKLAGAAREKGLARREGFRDLAPMHAPGDEREDPPGGDGGGGEPPGGNGSGNGGNEAGRGPALGVETEGNGGSVVVQDSLPDTMFVFPLKKA